VSLDDDLACMDVLQCMYDVDVPAAALVGCMQPRWWVSKTSWLLVCIFSRCVLLLPTWRSLLLLLLLPQLWLALYTRQMHCVTVTPDQLRGFMRSG